MFLCHVVFQLTLVFIVIRADQSSNSSGENSGDGGGGANNVGDFGEVTYLPAKNLQDQLLNTTDIAPDTLVAVASSYKALNDDSIGIGGTTAPNTTAFASILIVPSFANDTVSTAGNQSQPTPSDKRLGRTQLLYNCTSATNLWNLLGDSNVLKLEDFQQFPSSDSSTVESSSGSSANTSTSRDIVAVAVVQIADCATIENTSMGRPVVLNSFFGTGFQNSSPSYLYITNTVVLGTSSVSASLSSGECRLRLEMAQATLPEVYPQCKIRFQSTDLDTILLESSTTNDDNTNQQQSSRRLEDASSFDFIRDPSCLTECGADDLDHNTCYAPSLEGQQTVVQCKMQFYAKNSACNFECGDETGSPYNHSALDVSQCYSCYSESKYGCPSGYLSNSAGCCRVLTCPAISDSAMSSPRTFTLNLQPNRSTITNPSMLLYTSGDCSDPTNPSNDCCRITCENCFINMSIASLYAAVDVYSSSLDYYTATEMKLVGNSAINVKVVSPNGCKLESTTLKSFRISPLSIPLGLTSLEVDFTVDFIGELAIKPHGTSAEIGVTVQIQSMTVGSVNSSGLVDKQIVFQRGGDISKIGVDTVVELSATPTVRANLVFLDLANVGTHAGIPLFVRLESTVKYPELFAALPTSYLDDSSKYRGGDCTKPHFMEYRGIYGYKPVQMASFATIEIPWDSDLAYDKPPVQFGSEYSSSLFSGCISSEYDAIMHLTTAANAVTSATVTKISTALQKILMWALKFPDIDPNFLKISIHSSGQISVTIAVPPSVADQFPTQSELETQFYQVARTTSFSDTVSSFVGLTHAKQDGGVRRAATNVPHPTVKPAVSAVIPKAWRSRAAHAMTAGGESLAAISARHLTARPEMLLVIPMAIRFRAANARKAGGGRRAIIRVILHAARQKISPAIWLMDRSLGVAHATRDTGGFLRATTHVKLHTVLLVRRAATSKEIYSRATHVKQDGGVRTAAVNALRLTALKVTSAATQMTGRCPPAALARMVTTDQPARISANCPNYVRVQVVNSKMDEKSSAYRVRTATTDRHVRRSATSHTTARVHDVRKTRGKTSSAWFAMMATLDQRVRAAAVCRITVTVPDVILLEK
ncbi:hypothetical protein Pcac1_g12748 [Phytophthora cactorum]|nr:hypothetical protein Pcac1_g12748 [Phytophthora cactorum]